MSTSAPLRRLPLLVATVVSALALLLATSGRAVARSAECQHPMTTGEEATHLSHISAHTACVAVRALARFLRHPGNAAKLYRCTARPGYPVLRRHHFGRYRIRIGADGLKFARGRGSFYVSGTDFPLNCT